MNRVLIISFDLIKQDEPKKSYAVSHLLSYATQQQNHLIDYTIDHITVDANSYIGESTDEILNKVTKEFRPQDFDIIAISAYVWNEFLLNPLIKRIKASHFKGLIALGGYQISGSSLNKLKSYYPLADAFFVGYSEQTFHRFISSKTFVPLHTETASDFTQLVSPYLSGAIKVENGQRRLRWETKRGCYYLCSFCAHKELGSNGTKPSVHFHQMRKIESELSLFKEKNVQRVNVLDPLFNVGRGYLDVMQLIASMSMNSEFTFQVRLENLPHKEQELGRFMEYAKSINCVMEFGIQTLQENEWKIIGRNNNKQSIQRNLKLLKSAGINFEASLIYGLPGQTVSSFNASINSLRDMGCEKITAWPLMLLRGTPLYEMKKEYSLGEKILGDFNIPTVVSSYSFSYVDWLEMKSIADSLLANDRI